MLPCNSGGHTAYQDTLVSELLKFYPDSFSISKDSWHTVIEFWYLDLSLTDSLMADSYSKFGPEPRLPSCMLRSYLLSIKFGFSIDRWADLLKEFLSTLFLAGFPSETLQASVLSMIFAHDYGIPTLNTFLHSFVFLKVSLRRVMKKGIKLRSIPKLCPLDCFIFYNAFQ